MNFTCRRCELLREQWVARCRRAALVPLTLVMRRARTNAEMWANSMTTPLYQSLAAPHGDPRGLYPANELMMSRGRASVSRVQTSSRAGAQAYSETPDPAHGLRPSSRASTMASTYGNLRPSSRLSDFGDYGPGPDAGLRIDVDNLEVPAKVHNAVLGQSPLLV